MAGTDDDGDDDDRDDSDSGGNNDELDIAISGGSMGGLFAGLALRYADRPVDVDVFERSTGELKGRGAGIVAQPAILDFLSSHDIARPRELITTTATREYLGRDESVERAYEESITFTSWDALYRRLRDAFPDESYHTGRTTVGVDRGDDAPGRGGGDGRNGSGGGRDGGREESGNGGTATLRFEDGASIRADLAVIAEGGRSTTRADLLPEVSPAYAGYVAWRGVTPEDAVPPAVREQCEDVFTFYEGPNDLILAYLIPGPDGGTGRGERRLNWVWYDSVEQGERERLMTDADGRTHALTVPPGKLRADVDKELLAAAGRRLPKVFADLVSATDGRFVETIYDLEIPRMVFGRVCLLGDCAFGARPHTAAGTAKAAADGTGLADALDARDTRNGVGAALDDWERDRLAAGRRLVARGQRMGENYMS
jgi:2-polyprenyl-6-methoxyphenol hydroxylase-like FAD-dependent oxidoreductase